MARLADPSRLKYSLKHLTMEMEDQIIASKEAFIEWMLDELKSKIEL